MSAAGFPLGIGLKSYREISYGRARVLGIALIAIGIACWPGPALLGMLTYGALVTAYFLYLAFGGEWVGPLLGRQLCYMQS